MKPRTVIAAALLCACSGKTEVNCNGGTGSSIVQVDTDEIEATLTQKLTESGMQPTRVECPDAPMKPGYVITCQVELGGEKTYPLEVVEGEIDTAAGRVDIDLRWPGDGRRVNARKLEVDYAAQVTDSLGEPATIDCPEPLLTVTPELTVRCALDVAGARADATISFDDTLTTTGFDVSPKLLRARFERTVADTVTAKVGHAVTVRCTHAAIFDPTPDLVVDCTADDAGQPRALDVKLGTDGSFEWRFRK